MRRLSICWCWPIGNVAHVALMRTHRHCGLKFSRLVCGGAAADEDRVIRGLDDVAVIGIKERQFIRAEREVYGLGFAWIESDAREAFETANGLFDARAR